MKILLALNWITRTAICANSYGGTKKRSKVSAFLYLFFNEEWKDTANLQLFLRF